MPEPGLTPVAVDQRVALIDAVRGVALGGVLLVNVHAFGEPLAADLAGWERWPGTLDRVVMAATQLLAESKFYSLFSLLFGLGLAIQSRRAEAAGRPFGWFWLRRMGVLLAVGLLHAFGLWWGDILVSYAVLGVGLLVCRRWAPSTLIAWALVLLCVQPSLIGLIATATQHERARHPDAVAAGEAAFAAQARVDAEAALADYRSADLGRIARQRAGEVLFLYRWLWLFLLPSVLGMFLLGLAAGRLGWLEAPADHARLWGAMRWLGLPLGLAANAGYLWAELTGDPTRFTGYSIVSSACLAVGAPVLCLAYVGWLVRLAGPRLVGWLAPVGRMALTNYLVQSLVCTTVFYGYGLGLYGRLGPARSLVLALALYAVQIPLSAAWLRRFERGPLEALWRRLSYGRR